MTLLDNVYARAAGVTGKTEDQLKGMAVQVFGSMLYHAMKERGEVIWTITRIGFQSGLELEVEVNFPPRQEKYDGSSTKTII